MIINEELGDAGIYEALAPDTATGITSTIRHPTSGFYKGKMARAAMIIVETNPVRFRIDGTAPEAGVGIPMGAAQNIELKGVNNVKNFSCIDQSAAASTVHVQVYF